MSDGLGFDITTKGNGSLFLSKDHYHHHHRLEHLVRDQSSSTPENSQGLKKFTLIFNQEEIAKSQIAISALISPLKTAMGHF